MCPSPRWGVQLLPHRTVATALQRKIIINLPMAAFFGAAVSLFTLNVFTACRTPATDPGVRSSVLSVGPYVDSGLITDYMTDVLSTGLLM